MEDEGDKIKKALLKRALGYSTNEVTEEYSFDEEGNRHLSKKKVTKKHFSPDISAAKMLLERYYSSYEDKVKSMSDENLLAEKARLQNLIKGENSGT